MHTSRSYSPNLTAVLPIYQNETISHICLSVQQICHTTKIKNHKTAIAKLSDNFRASTTSPWNYICANPSPIFVQHEILMITGLQLPWLWHIRPCYTDSHAYDIDTYTHYIDTNTLYWYIFIYHIIHNHQHHTTYIQVQTSRKKILPCKCMWIINTNIIQH